VSAGERFDVAVVGGGLAGLTATRELGVRGRRVVVLEARDRLGGRAWFSSFAGTEVEMGGGFVHRVQPFIWAEIERYRLDVVDNPDPERIFQRRDDGTEEAGPEAFDSFLASIDLLCEGARTIIPDAQVIPTNEEAREADRLSLRDRLNSLDLDVAERDRLDALGSGLMSAPNDRAGFLPVVKSYALAEYDAALMLDSNGRWTIAGGTRSLVDAIAADVAGDVRMATPVEAIAQTSTEVTVRTNGGDVSASAAIVAVPLNTLGTIAFDPSLAALKQEAAATGSVGLGVKVWATLRDGYASSFATAPDRFPLTFAQTEAETPDGRPLVLAFGPSAERLPLTDHARVAAAIEAMLPGAKVDEVGGHDWVADPFSRGTWASYGPGTWLRWAPELERPEGRIAFAGSDIARGWGAYMDGAIETGFRAADEVEAILS
jgi:pseudooxynicotine oxidase